MLDSREAEKVQSQFGASIPQVLRDHAISHFLREIQSLNSEVTFFGGTALSRTYLINGRLSEDVDLYSSTREVLSRELDELPEKIEQEFPQASWEVLPSQVADPGSALLHCDGAIKINVQVLDSHTRNWQKIPTQMTPIYQRYSDVPPTQLLVPTLSGFVAMKVLAWFDRRKSRDLFDLDALSRLGKVSNEARILLAELVGHPISSAMLDLRISDNWSDALSRQTKLLSTEKECLTRLLEWWNE